MADRRRTLGNWGEDAVADYLRERKGCEILARQFRCRTGELDIVAMSPGGTLLFVEVKTRAGGGPGRPGEAVTPRKQRRLRSAAGQFLAARELDCPCRFDVAEVTFGDAGPKLRYIAGAF